MITMKIYQSFILIPLGVAMFFFPQTKYIGGFFIGFGLVRIDGFWEFGKKQKVKKNVRAK